MKQGNFLAFLLETNLKMIWLCFLCLRYKPDHQKTSISVHLFSIELQTGNTWIEDGSALSNLKTSESVQKQTTFSGHDDKHLDASSPLRHKPNRGNKTEQQKQAKLKIVVQNIEDDLYCSQLNTSHCFKNFLFCHFVPDPPAPVRVLVSSVCADCTFCLVCCSYYGWHLKWIVEHALGSEAKGSDSRSSQWTTGFRRLSKSEFTSNT